MQPTTVKFKHGNKSDFYTTLKERVDQYFESRHSSKFANWKMVVKAASFFTAMIITYSLILSGAFVPWQMLILAMIFGLSSAFFVFNVAHDASHGAFSRNLKINKFLTYSWNLVGMSNYIWDLKHNIAHHTYTNICGTDIDIDQGFLLRFHPGKKRRFFHRIQHLYAPILYGLFSIYVILIKDFQMYSTKRFGNKIINRHPAKEYAIAAASKGFYITYNLVIPYMVLNITWWQLLIGFVMMHMVIGNVMAFILTPVHVTHGTEFREPDHEGVIDTSWAVHQIKSTVDFAADSKVVGWFAGGLNTHVAHHIFPNICHIHYFDLTEIIKQTAKEFGLTYTNKSLLGSVKDHMTYLHDLGKADDPRGALVA